MSRIIFKARHALGQSTEGECLSAKDGFSARYDLDRLKGVFSRPAHLLFGQSYKDKILVCPQNNCIPSDRQADLLAVFLALL